MRHLGKSSVQTRNTIVPASTVPTPWRMRNTASPARVRAEKISTRYPRTRICANGPGIDVVAQGVPSGGQAAHEPHHGRHRQQAARIGQQDIEGIAHPRGWHTAGQHLGRGHGPGHQPQPEQGLPAGDAPRSHNSGAARCRRTRRWRSFGNRPDRPGGPGAFCSPPYQTIPVRSKASSQALAASHTPRRHFLVKGGLQPGVFQKLGEHPAAPLAGIGHIVLPGVLLVLLDPRPELEGHGLGQAVVDK